MFNLYIYSIYSLEIWRPGLVLSSRQPQHIGGFKLPEGNLCYGVTSPLGAGGNLAHAQSPAPQKEVNLRALKLLCQPNYHVASGDERWIYSKLHKLHHCRRCSWSHPLRRTHIAGCPASHNTDNPRPNDGSIMNCVTAFQLNQPAELLPACRA